MRILLKCPTRSRPQRIISTLIAYIRFANHPEQIGVAISCDEDDESMSRNLVHEELHRVLSKTAWHRIFMSPNKSKIQACNANMNEIEWEWDVVVLVSDDMIPQMKGWDDIIRTHMFARFPDSDGILWFNDGYQGEKLNTLCVFGRKMYQYFGYIYHPEYKSLFCDTELTDLCRNELKDKCMYVPYCIIRHEHPGTGYAQNMDVLYERNQKFWNEDMNTYIRRKRYPYDISFLIPTIPGRESGLHNITSSIHEKMKRIAPDLRYVIDISFDNREMSIGAKRQKLLEGAKGKYLAFVDDDDEITDAYVEDLRECIRGGFHTMRLYGRMKEYTFVHSLDVKLTDMMATRSSPPVFQRPPNHLNPMMADIARVIPFKNAVHGEDLDWTISLFKSNMLETQYTSDPSRIHYIYNLGARVVHPETISLQQNMSYEAMLKMVFTPSGAIAPPPQSKPQEVTLKLGPRGFVSR